MNSETGELFESREAALNAGVPKEALVELFGLPKAVRQVAADVAARRKATRKRQRASRKRNR